MFTCFTQAQTPQHTSISFETPFYEATDRWVLFTNPEENTYSLGFLFMDRDAGFTLDYETDLILENGKLINPNPDQQKEQFIRTRLDRDKAPVHILTEEQLNALNLTTPKWLEVYKTNSETAGYQIDIASWYNSVGANEHALKMLQPLYEDNKTQEKLLFELSYAYNALSRHPEALNVLAVALQVNDTEELFYKEKLYVYAMMVEYEAAKTDYAAYLKKSKSFQYRLEMLYNLAYTNYLVKNREAFDYWIKELRSLEKKDHFLVKNLYMMKLYWDEPRE